MPTPLLPAVYGTDAVDQLIGRDDDLNACLDVASRGDVRVVVVAGDEGVGTSALCRAIADRCESEGRRVVELPLGATADDVRRLTDVGWPVILLLDDVEHRSDEVSAAVLDASIGHDVVALGSHHLGAPFPAPFASAWRAGRLHRHECRPLGLDDVGAIAADLLGCPVTQPTTALLDTASGGRPLHLREILLAAVEDGTARELGDQMAIEQIPATSHRLAALVDHRLAALSDEERAAVHALAAVEPADAAGIQELIGEASLRRLEQARLAVVELDDRRAVVRLAQPLIGIVSRATSSAIERRTTQQRQAEALERFGFRRRSDRIRRAIWSLDGGVESTVPDLLEASRAVFADGDIELSGRLAATAFRIEPSFETGRALEAPLYEQGDPEQLEEHYEQWIPLANEPHEHVTVTKCLASGRYWRGGREDALLELVAALDDHTGPLRDELAAQAASLLVTNGRIDEAIKLGEPLLHSDPGVTQIHATLAAAHGWRSAGRPERAATVAQMVVAAYRAAGPEAYVVSSSVLANVEVHALAEAGRFDAAEQASEEAVRVALEARSPTASGLAHLAHSWIWVLRGRPVRAEQAARHAIGWLVEARHPGMVRWALTAQALARVQSGDLDGAERSRREVERIGAHPARIFEAHLARVDAWIDVMRGHPRRGFEGLLAAADATLRLGNVTAALACWHDLARLGGSVEAARCLEAIDVDELEGTYLTSQVEHVRALASEDLAELDRLTEDLATRGLEQLAAECAQVAASTLTRRNDSRGAARRLRRADQLLEDTEIATASHSRPTETVSLTRREREIAVAAARGITSREIADRLGLSVRTVDNHLGNVYRKLAVSNRVELAERLASIG